MSGSTSLGSDRSENILAIFSANCEVRGSIRLANRKATTMQPEFIRKWEDSGTGNCPALYKAENGNYVVRRARVAAR